MQRRNERMQEFVDALELTRRQVAEGAALSPDGQAGAGAPEAAAGDAAGLGLGPAVDLEQPSGYDDEPASAFPGTAAGRAALVKCLFPQAASTAAAVGGVGAAEGEGRSTGTSGREVDPGSENGAGTAAQERRLLQDEYRAQEAGRQVCVWGRPLCCACCSLCSRCGTVHVCVRGRRGGGAAAGRGKGLYLGGWGKAGDGVRSVLTQPTSLAGSKTQVAPVFYVQAARERQRLQAEAEAAAVAAAAADRLCRLEEELERQVCVEAWGG